MMRMARRTGQEAHGAEVGLMPSRLDATEAAMHTLAQDVAAGSRRGATRARQGSHRRGAHEAGVAPPAGPRSAFETTTAPAPVALPPGTRLQRRLRVGAANDPLEHEADRVAEQVMRAPSPCACGGGCTRCGAAAADATALRKPAGGDGRGGARTAPPIVHEVLRAPGRPLDTATRGFFEPRLGADLGHVQVHDDARAAASADAVHARAYTVGHHVVLGRGEPSPASRRLMAHELAHVVQQTGDAARAPMLSREVRGMVTQQRAGRPLDDAEWAGVEPALTAARGMVTSTLALISGIHDKLFSSSDPRTHDARMRRALALFRAHYKNPRPLDGLMAQEYFGYIGAALGELARGSFRVVPEGDGEDDVGGITYAYTLGRDATIYLTDAFFGRAVGGPGGLTMRATPLTGEEKARLMVHETAHFRLGVRHSGGVFDLRTVDCAAGFPIRNATQGLANAYVYGHFALCASRPAP